MTSSKKPYNHCRYAGNVADVWKHVLLLEVVRRLVSMKPTLFRYVETHAGPGYARLGDNGDWRNGIGTYMGDAAKPFFAHPYFDLVLPMMNEGLLYKGSWVLVSQFLQNTGLKNYYATIHELNADTIKMALCAIRKGSLEDVVTLVPRSGYDALQKLEAADLVLIDPPYRSVEGPSDDWRKALGAIERCKEKGLRYLLKYPIYNDQNVDHEVMELLRVSGGKSFEIRWSEESQANVASGCGLLADPATASIVADARGLMEQVAADLECEFELAQADQSQVAVGNRGVLKPSTTKDSPWSTAMTHAPQYVGTSSHHIGSHFSPT